MATNPWTVENVFVCPTELLVKRLESIRDTTAETIKKLLVFDDRITALETRPTGRQELEQVLDIGVERATRHFAEKTKSVGVRRSTHSAEIAHEFISWVI